MTFVDTNIFMYFVGADHPRRDEARAFLVDASERDIRLVTSAEVLQEILHRYLRTGQSRLANAAFDLVDATVSEVWPVERHDVDLARKLWSQHPGLEARDLIHLACCVRREPHRVITFDRALAAAWDSRC